MTTEEIEKLAKSDKHKSGKDLDLRLEELKSMGYEILDCIQYVKKNQGCSLKEAKSIVINSTAWIDKKEEFMQDQEVEMLEFLDVVKEDIEKIQLTFSRNGTLVTIKK